MKKSDFIFILKSFFIWRIGLFMILFFAVKYIPLGKHFLGGGIENYLKNPFLWSWANFDGEHYLSIAKEGYHLAEQAFFPLYPLFIKLLGGGLFSGLIISNLSFLIALIGLYKLINLDYTESAARNAILLLLLFPASFYFGAVYTESLFLGLVVWSFYLFRRNKYFLSSILGMFASATRVIGLILLPVYLAEIFQKKRGFVKKQLWLILIPLGIFSYMFYLGATYHDSFLFLHSLPSFGEQRSSVAIFLPQVIYRYLFKILPSLNYAYFAGTFTALMEFLVGILFLVLSVFGFFKLNLSYAVFLFLGYLIPTLSGSFSSLSRYVLVLFPGFILISLGLNKLNPPLKILIYAVLFLCLVSGLSLFSRGYWFS